MHSVDDIHRSLRRWATLALDDVTEPGTEWVVELARREVADQDRPVAVVENAGPEGPGIQHRAGVGRLVGVATGVDRDLSQPWNVTAYPSTDGSARDCSLRAQRVSAKLRDAVTVGMAVHGGPMRIALYEYEGVAFDADEPAEPYDYLWVADYSTRAIPDAFDDRRFSVVSALRVTWRAGGRKLPEDTPIASGGLIPHFHPLGD